jgi:branched-chain amino acid transport system ATP-binding protein
MIRVEGIVVGYGDLIVAREVSVNVGKGQTVIILGPNGAGKTTLLNVITGLVKPISGKIIFDGMQIEHKQPHEIAGMGISIVPEGGRVFPGLTVYNNLKVGSYSRRARKCFKERVKEIYDLFPILYDRQNQMAGLLSGGQRQMLAIARALIAKPKLLLLDEPSMGLAPLIVEEIFRFINNIKSQGYSILITEQNVRKALQVADYAYLMEAGGIPIQGSREEFSKNPDIQKAYLGI